MYSRRSSLIVAFILALSVCLPGLSQTDREEAAPPVRRALLIGINDYLVNDLPGEETADLDWIPGDLNGAINDVEVIGRVLSTRFGFEESDVVVLTDGEATRAAILEELGKLARESGPNDIIYIHFSGHGSRAEDASGDEDDGMDETILSHDARTAKVPDITDDELGAALAGLRSDNVFVALDSCHSGTATRGASALRTRAVPPDSRSKLYRGKSVVGSRGPGADSARHILMTGAASYQPALDGPVDGVYYGFFSYALARSLATSSAQATPDEIHEGVRRVFQELGAKFSMISMPTPQLEIPAGMAGRPVLRSAKAKTPWAEVKPQAKVPPDSGAVPIQLDRMDEQQRLRLAKALRQSAPAIEVVQSGEFARFVVDIEEGVCSVHDASGQQEIASFPMTDEQAAVRRLTEMASRALTVSDLLALDNPDSDIRLEVQVLPADQFGNARAVKVVGADVPAYKVRRAGEPRSRANSLVLHVRVDRSCYLTVVDVDTEGNVNLLFPNAYSQRSGFYRDGYVPGGQAVLLPDSLQKGNRAGFYWDYAPPAGIDTVRVFASTDLETAMTIRDHIAQAGRAAAGAGAATTRGGGAPGRTPFAALARKLAAASKRPPEQREAVLAEQEQVPEEPQPPEKAGADWTAASVTFLVEE